MVVSGGGCGGALVHDGVVIVVLLGAEAEAEAAPVGSVGLDRVEEGVARVRGGPARGGRVVGRPELLLLGLVRGREAGVGFSRILSEGVLREPDLALGLPHLLHDDGHELVVGGVRGAVQRPGLALKAVLARGGRDDLRMENRGSRGRRGPRELRAELVFFVGAASVGTDLSDPFRDPVSARERVDGAVIVAVVVVVRESAAGVEPRAGPKSPAVVVVVLVLIEPVERLGSHWKRTMQAEARPRRGHLAPVPPRLPHDIRLRGTQRVGLYVSREIRGGVGDHHGVVVPERFPQEILAKHQGGPVLSHRYVAPAVGGVPVVLDRVLGTPRDVRGDVGPPVTERFVRGDEESFLFLRPRSSLDVGSEVVVPALAALFARAHVEEPGDL